MQYSLNSDKEEITFHEYCLVLPLLHQVPQDDTTSTNSIEIPSKSLFTAYINTLNKI